MKKLTERDVTWNVLNENEKALLTFLYLQKAPETLQGIQEQVFGDLGTGTSMTRNVLRRIRVGGTPEGVGLVRRTKPGSYKITAKGEKLVAPTLERKGMRQAKKAIVQHRRELLRSVA
jgi:hypothetical protein